MNKVERRISSLSVGFLFIITFIIAFIPRLNLAFVSMTPVACDEIMQTIEIGHKLAFGKGFSFWEWGEGLRSYILPGFLAGIYKALDFAGVKDPYILNACLKIFLAALHSLGISLIFLTLNSWLGRFRAFLYTLTVSLFYIAAFISVRTLSETIVIPFVIASIYFASEYSIKGGWWRAILAGVFSGVSFSFRFQTLAMAGSIGIVILALSGRKIKGFFLFCAALAAIILIHGWVDLKTWGHFMQSFIKYFDYNFVKGGASNFGKEPWFFYFKDFNLAYPLVLSVAAVFLVIYSLAGKRELIFTLPLIFFSAIHIVTPHKESRFMFPVIYFLPLLSVLFLDKLAGLTKDKYRGAAVIVSVVMVLSTLMFYQKKIPPRWGYAHEKNNSESIEPSFELGKIPGIKKAYVVGVQLDFSGGYAYYHAPKAEIDYIRTTDEGRNVLAQNIRREMPDTYYAIRRKEMPLFDKYRKYLLPESSTGNWDIYRQAGIGAVEPDSVPLSRLSSVKKNGDAWDSPGSIRIWEYGLKVIIGEIRHSAEVEISLDNNDSYEIRLYSGASQIWKTIVVRSYNKDGLVVSKIQIPENISQKGFDSMMVVPLSGDNAYSVGHIKVE